MGGGWSAGDIADRIDLFVGGAQPRIDLDAVLVIADAGRIEIEIVQVRPATGRDQKMRAFDGFVAVFARDIDLYARQHAADLHKLDAAADRDALAAERIEHDGSRIRHRRQQAASPRRAP